MFSLEDIMYVNDDTLQSLQIIQADSHPSFHNQGPQNLGSKEGLSVFGLFHHLARTPQGKVLLRKYFLRPSTKRQVINERLTAVQCFLHPDNGQSFSEIVGNLKSVKNMRTSMSALRKGATISPAKGTNSGLTTATWTTIRAFAFHALQIKDLSQSLRHGENVKIRTKILEKFEPFQLGQVGRKISDIIDLELSALQERVVVRQHIDEDLDILRRQYEGLESMLSHVCQDLAEEVAASLQSTINVLYFPQIGFLTGVQATQQLKVDRLFDQDGQQWELLFRTKEVLYFKNHTMGQLDAAFGDIWTLICDKEIEIMHGLAQEILQYENMLVTASDICGELDCLQALASGAQRYNLCAPHIVDSKAISIQGGRHILQEMTVGSFIANNTHVMDDVQWPMDPRYATEGSATTSDVEVMDRPSSPCILVVTGPNYSGKSVYLKQVATIVYMAHVGSYVPAESATIGLTDKILTRVSTRESVARSQSSFMIDLQQIALALNLATPRSLLIIDEFGKGTEADDGAGLSAGVLEYLLSLEQDCPKTLFASHFHEIFEGGHVREGALLQFVNMQVQLDPEANEIQDQITFLYVLQPGRSVSSFGTCCAALNGIAPEVVKRAEHLVLLEARGEDLVAACATLPNSELVELEEAEYVARSFVEAPSNHIENARVLLDRLFESSEEYATPRRSGSSATLSKETSYDLGAQSYRSALAIE